MSTCMYAHKHTCTCTDLLKFKRVKYAYYVCTISVFTYSRIFKTRTWSTTSLSSSPPSRLSSSDLRLQYSGCDRPSSHRIVSCCFSATRAPLLCCACSNAERSRGDACSSETARGSMWFAESARACAQGQVREVNLAVIAPYRAPAGRGGQQRQGGVLTAQKHMWEKITLYSMDAPRGAVALPASTSAHTTAARTVAVTAAAVCIATIFPQGSACHLCHFAKVTGTPNGGPSLFPLKWHGGPSLSSWPLICRKFSCAVSV